VSLEICVEDNERKDENPSISADMYLSASLGQKMLHDKCALNLLGRF
jgi:hypothetical protein